MKVFKSFGTFLIIVFVIIVAIGLILGGYLVLFPEKDLFGFKYVQVHNTFNEQITTSVEDITAVNIESGRFNVIILPNEDENIFTATECMYYGFAQKDNAEIEVVSTLNAGLLTIELKEPSGLLLYSTTNLSVYIPYNSLLAATTLDVTTQKGNIQIGSSADEVLKLNFGATSLKSQKGNIGIYTSTITDDLSLETLSGDIGIISSFVTNTNTLNIKLGSGEANLKNFENIANIPTINLDITDNGKFQVNDIQNLIVDAYRGFVYARNVDDLTATTNSSTLYFSTINGVTQITQTGGGSITIDAVNEEITINAEKANLTINDAVDYTYLKTTSGKVVVSAHCFVSVETQTGDIELNYNNLASEVYYTSTQKYRTALINTANGDVDVKGVDFIEVNSTVESDIDIEFHDIASEESIITGQAGSIKIVTSDSTVADGDPNGTAFRITYTAKVETDVNVHDETTDNTANTTHSYDVYGTVTVSKLTINANDCSLWVRDKNLANI